MNEVENWYIDPVLYTPEISDDVLFSIWNICKIQGTFIEHGAWYIGTIDDSWYWEYASADQWWYCIISEQLFIWFHDPLILNFLHKCEDSLSTYIFPKLPYIYSQKDFIIETKGKQILRYGEQPIGVYESIPECTMIKHKWRNYIDDGTFQNDESIPIQVAPDKINVAFHPTSFFLGIIISLLLILAWWWIHKLLEKRKKT